ncbi:hypothetical protein Xen7305DRAFT_00045600 [Xenococcus sp. PCC 7305]|uniref:hypothetical protein n=1 Tax=Xenococcus sp. PCC 7305 TaxID=102125 RepID=UPI0002ABC489|nr:hypothetical protein [Xenococcus sp. PCC 7305]ELS04824.1 hypothetical protein Xen7305DRAFT_00045600 [Xenococcus sp. PCC 7305]
MNKAITLQEYVRIHMIAAEDFFKNTVIPSSGMSGEEVDEKLNYYVEQAHAKGKLSGEEKSCFLVRHTTLGIGKSNSISPAIKLKIDNNID